MANLELVALSAAEMAPTQQALSTWCDQKVDAITGELADLREHLLLAQANGWRLRGLQASITRTERRITYYQKMRDAVDAGYIIVPNFPVRLLAVRVDRMSPPHTEAQYSSSHKFEAKPQQLASGEGRYVDDRVLITDESYDDRSDPAKPKHVSRWLSGDYDETPDFPYALVKPAVLAATQRAMALKIFDTIGMVAEGRQDPIIVGQLLDPRGNERRVTFFIAWWLNTATL